MQHRHAVGPAGDGEDQRREGFQWGEETFKLAIVD